MSVLIGSGLLHQLVSKSGAFKFYSKGSGLPKYKFTYFNLNALGEPIRWAFKVAGVDFVDQRIPREDWESKHKFTGRFPTEQVPLLEIDGRKFTQSSAILRYLGRKFDLVTGDELKDLAVDQAHMLTIDGFNEYRKWLRENDETLKEAQKQYLINTALRLFLGQIQEIVASSGGPFIGGSKLTYADLSVANWFSIWASVIDPELPSKFPRLHEHNKAVLAIPEIKAWLEVRPKTSVYKGVTF